MPDLYREFAPPPQLSRLVECVWASSGSGGSHRVLPDGCMDILFDFSESARVRTAAVGTMTTALLTNSCGRVEMLGIRFRPGGLPRVLRYRASDLTDKVVALDDFRTHWELLANTAPPDRAGQAMRLIAAAEPDRVIRHCTGRLNRGMTIAALAREVNLSERQLERRFASEVGVAPKTFGRIARFRRLTAVAMHNRHPRWASLAADFRYSDQAHLTREFQALAGLTPRQWHVGFVQDAAIAAR